jgi:hypothetical protein
MGGRSTRIKRNHYSIGLWICSYMCSCWETIMACWGSVSGLLEQNTSGNKWAAASTHTCSPECDWRHKAIDLSHLCSEHAATHLARGTSGSPRRIWVTCAQYTHVTVTLTYLQGMRITWWKCQHVNTFALSRNFRAAPPRFGCIKQPYAPSTHPQPPATLCTKRDQILVWHCPLRIFLVQLSLWYVVMNSYICSKNNSFLVIQSVAELFK